MELVSSNRRFASLAFASIAALPLLLTAAQKPTPAVRGSWVGAPSSIQLCKTLNLVLHVEANADASDVAAEILPSPGIEIVGGSSTNVRSLLAGAVLDLPVRVRFVANGEWTLGARLTARRGTDVEVSGAVINVVAARGKAVFGPPATLALADVGTEKASGPPARKESPPAQKSTPSVPRTLCSPLASSRPGKK